MTKIFSDTYRPRFLILGLMTLCLMAWTIQQDFSPWKPFQPRGLGPAVVLIADGGTVPHRVVRGSLPQVTQNPSMPQRNQASRLSPPTSAQTPNQYENEMKQRMRAMQEAMMGSAGVAPPLSPAEQLQQQLQNAVGRYQAATDESGQRAALRIEISDLLGMQYDSHLQAYEQQVAELESRLASLREQVKKRRDAKSRLVALKLELLLSQAEGIGWPDAFSSNSPTGQSYPEGTSILPGPTTQIPTLPGPGMVDAGSKNLLEVNDMSEEDRMKAMQKMFGAGSNSGSSEGSSGRSGMSGISGRGGGMSGMSGRSGAPSGMSGRSGMPGMSRRNEGNDTTDTSDTSGGGAPATAPSETATFDQQKCLHEVMLAVHNYVDTFGEFPFHARHEQSERLSWLVRILPWLNEADLANRFDLSQAWDSEHNREWLDHQPALLGAGRKTQIRWVESSVRHFRDITDGTSVTIACILGGEAVYWTEQRPISQIEAIDLFKSLPADGELSVAMYDGSVRKLKPEMGLEAFKALLTPNGGEPIQ